MCYRRRNGARSRFSAFYPKANYGLQGANPLMFVRIIALPTARVMNTTTQGALHGKTKSSDQSSSRAKRVLRRDSRSHKQREEESVPRLCRWAA